MQHSGSEPDILPLNYAAIRVEVKRKFMNHLEQQLGTLFNKVREHDDNNDNTCPCSICGGSGTSRPMPANLPRYPWYLWLGSNQRPSPYEGAALPTELQRHFGVDGGARIRDLLGHNQAL